jgi:uncharacterized protein (TIGR03437 family)
MHIPPVVVLLTLAVSCSAFGQSYTISTVAGNGTQGFSGDTSLAAFAQLNGPKGVAVDSVGNFYIADFFNNRIRKVSNGAITTVAGNGSYDFSGGESGDGGLAISAQLDGPSGVAVDSAGNLYIADTLYNRIRKVSNGVITTVAGGQSGLVGSFGGDGGPAISAELAGPRGVAVDSAGNLYIADTENNRIRKVSNGVINTVAGDGVCCGPSGDGGPAISAQLEAPSGVAADSAGNLYIADTDDNLIRKVSNGVITTVAGDGGCCGDEPLGVAVDSAGNVYIADTNSNRIQKVSGGVITTVAGTGQGGSVGGFSGDGGPATSAQLNDPQGVAVDSAGNVYIADTNNNRIRMLVPTPPTVTAVVNAASFSDAQVIAPGEIVSIFGTDLGPASPSYLTLDSTGKVSTSIGGVTVSFSGYLAPLTYVSSTQINAIVPYEIAGNPSPFVEVTFAGEMSNEFSLQLATSAPEIFTQNGSGTGPGAILNQNFSLNTQALAAAVGSIVQIYMTGEGLTTPAQATGAVTLVNTSGVGPLTPAPQLAVSVMIGGQPADLAFAGEAPYFVAGVLQVNAVVPATATSGANSITVQVGNQISQTGVTVWVQ